jgi:hypothetical protein
MSMKHAGRHHAKAAKKRRTKAVALKTAKKARRAAGSTAKTAKKK